MLILDWLSSSYSAVDSGRGLVKLPPVSIRGYVRSFSFINWNFMLKNGNTMSMPPFPGPQSEQRGRKFLKSGRGRVLIWWAKSVHLDQKRVNVSAKIWGGGSPPPWPVGSDGPLCSNLRWKGASLRTAPLGWGGIQNKPQTLLYVFLN